MDKRKRRVRNGRKHRVAWIMNCDGWVWWGRIIVDMHMGRWWPPYPHLLALLVLVHISLSLSLRSLEGFLFTLHIIYLSKLGRNWGRLVDGVFHIFVHLSQSLRLQKIWWCLMCNLLIVSLQPSPLPPLGSHFPNPPTIWLGPLQGPACWTQHTLPF